MVRVCARECADASVCETEERVETAALLTFGLGSVFARVAVRLCILKMCVG